MFVCVFVWWADGHSSFEAVEIDGKATPSRCSKGRNIDVSPLFSQSVSQLEVDAATSIWRRCFTAATSPPNGFLQSKTLVLPRFLANVCSLASPFVRSKRISVVVLRLLGLQARHSDFKNLQTPSVLLLSSSLPSTVHYYHLSPFSVFIFCWWKNQELCFVFSCFFFLIQDA